MGCGASKGKAEGAEENIEITFKTVNVGSLDRFFERAKELSENLASITQPLQEQKDAFFETTGFYAVCGTGNFHQINLFRGQACIFGYVPLAIISSSCIFVNLTF